MDEATKQEVVQNVTGLPSEEAVEQTRAAILEKLEAAIELTKRAKFPTAVIFVASPDLPVTKDSQVEFVSVVAGDMSTSRDFLMFTVATFSRAYEETVKPDIPEAQPAPESTCLPAIEADAAEAN